MRWLERFRMAMLMLFQRETQTARLDDELAFHLEQQIKENIARGLAPEEARYAALPPKKKRHQCAGWNDSVWPC